MDIYDISVGLAKLDILSQIVRSGQKVRITRILTIEYEVDVRDILEDMDETEVSLESLIEDEMNNNPMSVDSDNGCELDKLDDLIVSVTIV